MVILNGSIVYAEAPMPDINVKDYYDSGKIKLEIITDKGVTTTREYNEDGTLKKEEKFIGKNKIFPLDQSPVTGKNATGDFTTKISPPKKVPAKNDNKNRDVPFSAKEAESDSSPSMTDFELDQVELLALEQIKSGKYVEVDVPSFYKLVVLSKQFSEDELQQMIESAIEILERDVDYYVDGKNESIRVRGGGRVFIKRTGNRDMFNVAKENVELVLKEIRSSYQGNQPSGNTKDIKINIRGNEGFYDIRGIEGVGSRSWVGLDFRKLKKNIMGSFRNVPAQETDAKNWLDVESARIIVIETPRSYPAYQVLIKGKIDPACQYLNSVIIREYYKYKKNEVTIDLYRKEGEQEKCEGAIPYYTKMRLGNIGPKTTVKVNGKVVDRDILNGSIDSFCQNCITLSTKNKKKWFDENDSRRWKRFIKQEEIEETKPEFFTKPHVRKCPFYDEVASRLEYDGIFTGVLLESVHTRVSSAIMLDFLVSERIKGAKAVGGTMSLDVRYGPTSGFSDEAEYMSFKKDETYLVYYNNSDSFLGKKAYSKHILLISLHNTKRDIEDLRKYSQIKGEGIIKLYHDNGQLRVACPYENGKLNGKMKIFDKDGNLNAEQDFVAGVLSGPSKKYYKTGELSRSYKCINGVQSGTEKIYSKTGVLFLSINYIHGVLSGTKKVYYKTGELNSTVNFINGKQCPPHVAYYENGVKRKQWYYKENCHSVGYVLFDKNGKRSGGEF